MELKDNAISINASETIQAQREDLVPRDYQLEIFETVKEKNSIIVLGTGSGKTFISILLIKELGHQIRGSLSKGSKRSIFVVNSVPLVFQQTNAIKRHTGFKVGSYEGSMGVDFWSEQQWKEELENHEVIVIVAQIFLNIILHKLINFSDINLIVLDECHHAQGSHPMREFMRQYSKYKEHNPSILPRICGMTASVINCKVANDQVSLKMKNLEIVLDSSLITTHYQSSVSKYMTNCQEMVVLYKSISTVDNPIVKLINYMTATAMEDIKRTVTLTKSAEKFINKLGLGLIDMLGELGEYCLCEAIKLEVDTLKIAESDDLHMKKVYQKMSIHLNTLHNSLEKIWCSFGNILSHLTPKMLRLIEILLKGSNTNFSALVFVQRRNTAKLIYYLLSKISKENDIYSFLRVGVITGGLYSIQREEIRLKEQTKQKKVIEDFRRSLLNVIVCTNVLEEGIDIRHCNLVVRFSIPQTFRSYIQSLGRARAIPSYYITLANEHIYEDLLSDISCNRRIHQLLNSSCFNRELPTLSEIMEDFSDDADLPAFEPFGPLGAKITGLSSISLLNLYCARLPKDRFTNLTVNEVHTRNGDSYCVGLTLPINASFRQTIWSEPRRNCNLAKKDASLRVCKELYFQNKLNSHLLPKSILLDVAEKDHLGIHQQFVAAKKEIGTRKHRQIHKRKICSAFRETGSFLHSIDFHQINKLRSDISFGSEYNIGFLSSEVISSTKFNLEHMKWGKLQITPRFIKQLDINEDMSPLLKFHKNVFTQVMFLNKDLFSYGPFTAQQNVTIVPLTPNYQIDYRTLFKVNESIILNEEDKIKLLNNPKELLNKIVKPQYLASSDVYFVKEISWDYTPQSVHSRKPKYNTKDMTFTEYFKTNYNIDIKNDNQPLFNCSHMPRNLNCLSSCQYRAKVNNVLLLIPEICDIFSIPATLYWKITCIPSIFHRINGLQLETELFGELLSKMNYNKSLPLDYEWVNSTIDSVISSKFENICVNIVHKKDPVIPSGAILQALTPISTMDQFNLERLEVLGDAYLKFSCSKYLYLKESKEDEGVLTQCRSNIICNKTLFILAEKRHLGDFVQGINLQHSAFPIPYGSFVKPEVEKVLLRDLVNPTEWCNFGQKKLIGEFSKVYNPYTQQLLADKCISDTVESLIGAMLLCGGEDYANEVMKWFGFRYLHENIKMPVTVKLLEKEEAEQVTNMITSNCLDRLETVIGYSFKNKCILLEACTHPSYSYNKVTGCYQRLEFLGDAVLDYLITGYIYARYRDADPGRLTDWRSFYVNNETLARIAVKYRLYAYLLHLSPSLANTIRKYIFLMENEQKEFNFEKDNILVEDIEVPKALGDLVEAIIGAVYVDSQFSLDVTWNLVKFLFKEIFESVESVPINCVRRLYERDSSVSFECSLDDNGSIVTAIVKGLKPIKVHGKNKRIAKQAAAKYALRCLDNMDAK